MKYFYQILQKYIYIQNAHIGTIRKQTYHFLKNDTNFQTKYLLQQYLFFRDKYLFQKKYSVRNIFSKSKTFIAEIAINIKHNIYFRNQKYFFEKPSFHNRGFT